jgi:sugar/nucleoside kinase (ribokinase family)
VGEAIAKLAKANNIPVVIDGGSWKPGFEKVLPFVDYAICSANFHPPNCHTTAEVFTYLSQIGIPDIAMTQGEKPIQFLAEGKIQALEVPQIQAVDTLGAGDIFHGAFCHYILGQNFTEALAAAAKVATQACQYFGSRQWMQMDTTDLR